MSPDLDTSDNNLKDDIRAGSHGRSWGEKWDLNIEIKTDKWMIHPFYTVVSFICSIKVTHAIYPVEQRHKVASQYHASVCMYMRIAHNLMMN